MKKRLGFTLVELLVVVAIVVLLIALLLPQLAKAKEEAKLVKCQANLHALGIALASYTSQNKDMMPSEGSNVPITGSSPSSIWLPDWYGTAGPGQLMGWADQMYVDGDFQGNTDWKGRGGAYGDGSLADNNLSWHYPTWGYGIMQCPKHSQDYQWTTGDTRSDSRSLQGYSLSFCARSVYYDGTPGSPNWITLWRNLNPAHIMVAEATAQMGAYSSYYVPAHMQYSTVSPNNYGYGMFERHLRNNTLGANYLMADGHVEYSQDYGWAPSPININSNRNWATGYTGPNTYPNGAPNLQKQNHIWAHGVSDQ